MKSNKWKMIIMIGTSSMIIFLIIFLVNYFGGKNAQAKQTQIVESIQNQEDSIRIISPSLTEYITATQEEDQLHPSMTFTITQTHSPTLEPEITRTSTPTTTPSQVSTTVPASPTNVPFTPTEIIDTPTPLPPEPTEIIDTPLPLPTETQVTLVSCGVSPSTIPGGTLSTQVYWAQFTPGQAGLGFDLSFDVYGSGQRGCSAVSDNSGYASCEGSAGTFPFGRTITVTFRTSVGDCITNIYTD